MRKLESPVARPDRAPYFKAEIEGRGYTFVLPTPGQFAPIAARLAEVEALTAVEVEAALGDLLLVTWADEEYALEATDGAAAFMEAHRAGWRASETLAALYTHVVKELSATILEPEVKARVSFFGARGRATPGE